MTTVVELDVPAERLGFARTFDRIPSFEFQVRGLVGDAPPLCQVSGTDRPTIETTLEEDPSVDVIARLSSDSGDDADDERAGWLFRLAFDEGFKLFEQIVLENDGAIMSARGRDGTWNVQLLFHDRESVSTCHERFQRYEYDVEVVRVRGIDDLERAGTPLTETQYETIWTAHELGYFDVPREITLEELAAELDVSHQALSERLRRSHAALISSELEGGLGPTKIDP
ncbi:helix-turn-helix domain-containing protein [Halopiger goleimassiliensis]|uniref:helix-turn-helix domain-containing protein n=1 Tax=Halopiger goleimassiliensis TaxID=1293048 RepID=UPI0006776874|nr:helix-turn-helix domain-containing protein [Halopiger goleimassiliensis]